MKSRFLLVLTSVQMSGCFFFLPLKGVVDTGEVYCPGSIYEGPIFLDQNADENCRFEAVTDVEGWGSGYILLAKAPEEVSLPSGDTLSLQISSTAECLAPGSISDSWDGEPVANGYLTNYGSSSCDENCSTVTSSGHDLVTVEIEFCDENGDYPGEQDNSTPEPPAEGTYTVERTGYDYSGKLWYTILSRVGNEVCGLLRWEPAPQSARRFALVLAQETVLTGGVKEYDLIDDVGLYYISTSTTATVTPSNQNRIVQGTTGSQTLDSFYSVSGQWTFTPASGPGAGWPPGALHWGHKTCSNLRASN